MKKFTIEIKWALIFTVAGLVWMFLEKLVGLHGVHIDKHAIYTNFFALVAIFIYVLALLDKRKNVYQGIMTWKQGFMSGVIISLIVTILTPVSQLITSQLITPEYFPNAIDYVVSTGKMDQVEAEAYFNLSNYIIQSALFAPVVGVITSALVAVFTRKKA